MSVVIVGGNECMVCQYQDICSQYGCQAKIFAKKRGSLRKSIGTPELVVLMTSTVSHKLVESALQEAKRRNIPIARSRSSSASALQGVLSRHFAPAVGG